MNAPCPTLWYESAVAASAGLVGGALAAAKPSFTLAADWLNEVAVSDKQPLQRKVYEKPLSEMYVPFSMGIKVALPV